MKITPNGDTLATLEYTSHVGSMVTQSPDSGLIVSGNVSYGTSTISRFGKINASGNFAWSHTIVASFDHTCLQALKQTHDGGYILAGNLYNQSIPSILPFLIKVNSVGDTLWSMAYDTVYNSNSLYAFDDVIETQDGGFIACGGDLVIKTDSLGLPVWIYKFPFGSNTVINQIISTYDGGYLLAGSLWDTLPPYNNIFLAKIDSNGQSNCPNLSFSLPFNHVDVICTSQVYSSSSVTPDILIPSCIISSGDSLVILNAICQSTGIETVPLQTTDELIVYPNPAGNFININNHDNHKVEILITDIPGKVHYRQTNVSLPLQIKTTQFAGGMYNVSLISKERISTKKFIISR
jgi:hypothetical protein